MKQLMKNKKTIIFISVIILMLIFGVVVSIIVKDSQVDSVENDLSTSTTILSPTLLTTENTTLSTTADATASVDKTTEIVSENQYEEVNNINVYDFSSSSIGDVIDFGYGFRWRVIDKESDKILVISEDIIDFRSFDEVYNEKTTWENSSIRTWINDFYKDFFGDEEYSMILTTTVINNQRNEYGISGGNDTDDKFFLLSVEEAEKYFRSNDDRVYLDTNSNYILGNDDQYLSWWLRTPGEYDNDMACVSWDGSIVRMGTPVDHSSGVRPAMWLKIK